MSFWQRAIVIPATQQLPVATDPTWWLKVMYNYFGNEWYFFIAASGGFLAFVLGSLRQGPRSIVSSWLSPRMAGLPLLTLGWIAFNMQDFQGPPDMMPILAALAFWVGWSGHLLLRLAAPWPTVANGLAGLVLSVATVYGLGDAFLYEPGITLDEERAIVAEILQPSRPDGIVLTFEATEVYVLDERPAPANWSLNLSFRRFANVAFPDGCSGMQRSVRMKRPSVVVFHIHPWRTRCVRALARWLRDSGYSRHEVDLPWRRHLHYDPKGSQPPLIRLAIYTRRR
jgi:hypothetical protein